METKRFQVYRISIKANKIILAFVVAMSIFSLWGILTILITDKQKLLGVSIPGYLIFLMQSVLGIYLTWRNFKNEKYFVSWDDNEIRYQLPKDKEAVLIKIEDIQSVEKTNREFRITLTNNDIKNFTFNYFYFPTRQTILDYFESVKARVEEMNKTIN
jgi:hypothetical protein